MDPCPFVRLIVESLSLKLPPATSKPTGSGIHPSTTPCFCTLHLSDVPSPPLHTSPLPLFSEPSSPSSSSSSSSSPITSLVVFHLDPADVYRFSASKAPASLAISVFSGRTGASCGFSPGRLVGKVRVAVDLRGDEPTRGAVVYHSGWVAVGKGPATAQLHLVLRSEPDPRFVFQFGGEPECSPVVYQINVGGGGGRDVRQPVFSCRFSAERRCTRSRSLPSESSKATSSGGSWLMGSDRDRARRRDQRKGWTVTIHDLSGSPVAAASMITPFVPSPGSDRVSRTNPGAWLILQPAAGFSASTSWKPWGRLEAWREPSDAIGYRFELVVDPNSGTLPLAEGAIGVRKGGEFRIDVEEAAAGTGMVVGGFVMGSTVEGEGKVSRPTVRVGAQHVRCMTDAALFVALSAAVDLSMDACRLFSKKLRKELISHQDQQD